MQKVQNGLIKVKMYDVQGNPQYGKYDKGNQLSL